MMKTRKCTKCKVITEWKSIPVNYEVNGVKIRIEKITAMVCPKCGEKYLPGQEALVISKAVDAIVEASTRANAYAVVR